VGEQDVGDAGDVVLHLPIGDVAVLPRLVAGPDDGRLLAALRQVAVDAVVAGVEAPPGEPGEVDLLRIDVHDVAGRVVPVENAGLLAPEVLRRLDRASVHLFVLLEILDIGSFRDLRLDGDHGFLPIGAAEGDSIPRRRGGGGGAPLTTFPIKKRLL